MVRIPEGLPAKGRIPAGNTQELSLEPTVPKSLSLPFPLLFRDIYREWAGLGIPAMLRIVGKQKGSTQSPSRVGIRLHFPR